MTQHQIKFLKDDEQAKPLSTNRLLNRKEAADYLGTEPNTLAVWACTGRYNLPFVKIGNLAKYRIADLDAFIERRTVGTTK